MPKLEIITEKINENRILDPKNNEEDRLEVKENGQRNFIEDGIVPEFRLILTSMRCDYFPITILQNGVKLTNEPPKGIKANMLKSLRDFPNDVLTSDIPLEKQASFRSIFFSLCLYHAVILERKKFGPLGYNIMYDFNDSDLETTIKSTKTMLVKYPDIPWDAIKFMTADINYGGRVTDDWDRRTVSTILDVFFSRDSLLPGFQYTDSPNYYVPEENTIEGLIEVVKTYPEQDPSAIFGMNSNAEIAYQLKESKKALEIVLSLQVADNASKVEGEKSADDVVIDFCVKLQSESFPTLILKEGQTKPEITNYDDPLDVCLVQEVERFNTLLMFISQYVVDLARAVKGELIMTEELDEAYQAILNNQVPQSWSKLAYPSLKNLANWYTDLLERVEFFRKWYIDGKPTSYWLPAFYYPQGFLTSVLQSYSRATNIPIDKLNFEFEFKNIDPANIVVKPEKGCYIRGLFMEGCRYDLTRNVLADNPPGQMFALSPVIYFIPTDKFQHKANQYAMPLYKTTKRQGSLSPTGQSTNFILTIYCNTKYPPEYWIVNGAAFMCDRNE